MRAAPGALSPDAHTWFGALDSSLHNPAVDTATAQLRGRALADLSARLIAFQEMPSSGSDVAALLHTYGVNMRYLGLLYALLPASHPAAALVRLAGAPRELGMQRFAWETPRLLLFLRIGLYDP